MSNSITSWFFEPPIDFESKKYRLLDNAMKAEKMIDEGDIKNAMQFIEDHLVCFYKFKTDNEILNQDNLEIIGIDPLMLNLIYKENPAKDQQKEIGILSDVAELGILEFEALHSMFRIEWRDIEMAIKLDYMPAKTPFIKNGHVFLSNMEENWTRVYTFKNPTECSDWTEFKLDLRASYDYQMPKILDFVRQLKDNGSDEIILNCYIDTSFRNTNAVDFVLACKVYYKLLKDYMF